MYLNLKDNFVLRGWKLLPTGVIDTNSGTHTFLKTAEYRTLRKCDGTRDEDDPLFTDADRENFKTLTDRGFIERRESPTPLKPAQVYRFHDNRFVGAVHWLITGKCNARCKHCYMSAPEGVCGEFSHEVCMNLIEQMSGCGVQKVILSGGEPLIRADFWAIVDSLLAHGIRVDTIMSNGLSVNDALLDKFDERGIKPHFSMSFDGVDGWHDWLRGVKGAEKAVLHAFDICHRRGFATSSEFCLHKGNRHVLRDSIKLLGKLGVGSVKVNRLELNGAGKNISDYAISQRDTYEEFLRYIPQYIEDGAPTMIVLAGFFSAKNAASYQIGYCKMPEDRPNEKFCVCGHVRNIMHIDATGRILPCIPFSNAPFTHKHFPTVNEVTLKEVLNGSDYFKFVSTTVRDYFNHNETCAACEFKYRCCGGCRGNAVTANGTDDFWARDPITCSFFKDGYYSRLTELMDGLNVKLIGA